MHKTFISYHHSGEQKLKDELVNTAESKDYFIDKSVSDGDIDTNLSSEAYCGIYRYSTFINDIEKYIDEAFEKKSKVFDIKKKNNPGIKTISRPFGVKLF